MSTALFLQLISGFCWAIVYLDGTRIGFKDKSYAIPFLALVLNLAWELLHLMWGYEKGGASTQVIVNAVWLLLDLGIIYTFLRFGKREFSNTLAPAWFYLWAGGGLIAAGLVQYAFVATFGLELGASYAAFFQNLLMSALFINMLYQRKSSRGQTLTIAIGKWIGTLAPTLLYGYIGRENIGGPNKAILLTGLLISLLDLIYIYLLISTKRRENAQKLSVL